MTIIGISGDIGSGKSFTQLKHGLKYVDQRQKQLVTNFAIDVVSLRKYASLPKQYQSFLGYLIFNLRLCIHAIHFGFWWILPFIKKPKKPKISPQLPWVKYLCENGGIIQIPSPENLQSLIIPDSVVLLDEAGILLNSRDFANTPKKLLADLAQSRKLGTDLIWCAQFSEQVDKQIRLLTQFWIHCESISIYDKKMRRPKLKYKKIFWFRCSDYQLWLANPKARGSFLKTKFVFSTIYEGGLLSPSDKRLFDVYDSFDRLDNSTKHVNIRSLHVCKLPIDYYFERLNNYTLAIDPLSKHYDSSIFPKYVPSPVVASSESNLVRRQNFSSTSRKQLIGRALKSCRANNIKPPYFKNMTIEQIKSYIN